MLLPVLRQSADFRSHRTPRRVPRVRLQVERLEDRTVPSAGNFLIHDHPELTIIIDGEERTLPDDIGLVNGSPVQEPDSSLSIHTHDSTGTVHVESNVIRDFTLRECFEDWDRSIAESIIEGTLPQDRRFLSPEDHETRCLLIGARLQITVNGQPASSDPRAIMLRDGDEIVISAITGRGPSSPAASLSSLAPASLLDILGNSLTAASHGTDEHSHDGHEHSHDGHDHDHPPTTDHGEHPDEDDPMDGLGSILPGGDLDP